MPRKEWTAVVLIDEILRRKGVTRAWAEATTRERPWYLLLTWTNEEEADYRRWWNRQVRHHRGLSGERLDKAWALFDFEYGLHNRDECAEFDREGKGCEWCRRPPRGVPPGQDHSSGAGGAA